MKVWLALLDAPPNQPFAMLSLHSKLPPLYTDASTLVGFGGTWGTSWFYGTWPERKTSNIAVLELYPITLALLLLHTDVNDTVINIYTDNQALVSVVNKLYSKDVALRRLIRPLAALCLKRNVKVLASHIAGVCNIGPDLLSRGNISKFKARFPSMNTDPFPVPNSLSPVESGFILWKNK